MICVGENEAILCKGDFEPAAIYKGDTFITGAKNTTLEGELISAENTYKAPIEVEVSGKAEQAVTVQGKNLFNKNKLSYVGGYFNGSSDGDIITDNSLYDVTDYIQVQPNSAYVKTNMNSWVYLYNSNKVVIGRSNVNPFVTLTDTAFVRGSLLVSNLSVAQLELGSTATAYEPFVPNSPSPDYPSDIQSVLSGTSVNVSDVNDVVKYSATLDRDLYAIKVDAASDLCNYIDENSQGWCSDEYIIDGLIVKHIKRVGIHEFDGTEATLSNQLSNYDNETTMMFSYRISDRKSSEITPMTSNYFKYSYETQQTSSRTDEGFSGHPFILYYNYTYWRINRNILSTQDINGFRDFLYNKKLSGNPVTVYYILDTPIETDITDTELGQAILALHSVPRHTNIYSTPEDGGLIPNIKTTMKTY